MSAILLKYPTFGMCFHGQNKYKIEFSAHFSVCTKKLIYKYSEKHLQSIADEKEERLCLLLLELELTDWYFFHFIFFTFELPVTNCMNLALSVWSKDRNALQNQIICNEFAWYLWYSVLALRSSISMTGRPLTKSSNSCSLNIEISLRGMML